MCLNYSESCLENLKLNVCYIGTWSRFDNPYNPTHMALLEPFPDRFNVFHMEIHMTNIFVKFLQVQDRSQFIRTPLRFRYCKVWTNILSLYWAHLTDGSFLEKPSNFLSLIGKKMFDFQMLMIGYIWYKFQLREITKFKHVIPSII